MKRTMPELLRMTFGLPLAALALTLMLLSSASPAQTAPAQSAPTGKQVAVEWVGDNQPHRLILTGRGETSSAIKIAGNELQDYLNGVYANQTFAQSRQYLPRKGKAILLGTPASFPLITRYVNPDRLKRPESYVVTTAREGDCEIAVIAGADERGVIYGVYALLEKLGYGFYLSRDAAPVEKTGPVSFQGWDLANAPLFPHRLVFDWHNFLSGCSTWSLPEWKKWIIQSQKMGYNAVMVHAYGNNPMVEFEFGGQAKPVGYLSTTRAGRDWSTMHVNDVRRLWGGQVFDKPVFGSEAAMVPDAQRVAAVRKMMHDAFQCAKERAMGVYFAFDMETFQANPQNVIQTLPESARFLVPSNSGNDKLWLADPDTAEGFDYYKAQVAALLESYPQITTLVCWFRWGAGTPWMRMKLENMPPAWQAEYRKEIAKTPEAAKLALPEGCFALSKAVKAYARALQELGRADITVATGTWRFEFYPGCDRFMPREVAFIGLDYDVLHGHSCFDEPEQRAAQAVVGAHRAIIPIAWAHHDDGAYLGRSFTPYEKFASTLGEMKASGYGIIHWTTRPLDLYFKALITQVWETTKDQPLRESCAAMAERLFGPPAREKGGEYLYQWITTAPLFSRETSENFIDRKLEAPATVAAACDARLKILDGIDKAALTAAGSDNVGYYQGLERWIRDVHREEDTHMRALERVNTGDRAAAKKLMTDSHPEAVIEAYAQLFSSLGGISTGEQGSVIAMNTRWFPQITSLRQALGLAPVRLKFGPTQHDPLAQSAGRYTFFFGPKHELWETLGEAETGAHAVTLASNEKLEPAENMPAEYEEICRSGVAIDKPLTVTIRPKLQRSGREASTLLPAGDYQLTLLFTTPATTQTGAQSLDITVQGRGGNQRSAAMQWYGFQPITAKYLRLALHGTNQNMWNSIYEVQLATLRVSAAETVRASEAVNGCPASAAVDGKPGTRWAANGNNHWLQFPLDPDKPTDRIGILWYEGTKRVAKFEIEVSSDGRNWEKVKYAPTSADGADAARATGGANIKDQINLKRQAGEPARVVLKQEKVHLGEPGRVDVNLTPGEGSSLLLCGAVLEPQS